ncbi:LAMI_0F10660g1_1 [Lachancea mirantina]|uniref:LAMI_0F10660g1_1 n=1 Tax=Lachancea mirantina TaxID=1230905 RepID=A0A1G4K212_9SACH|nr:LAMI_0F10660g1_1 [Lachancea mirantina]
MADLSLHKTRSTAGSSSENEDDQDRSLNDIDVDFEKLGRGFPMISLPSIWSSKGSTTEPGSFPDLGQWTRKFQVTTFINDLHKGLSFSNALTRLQTVKAVTEEALLSTLLPSRDEKNVAGEEPAGVTPAASPKVIPPYNDMVLPRDKDPSLLDEQLLKLTELPQEALHDEATLRDRIRHIQELDVEPAKKAMMVQRLMMGKHFDETSRRSPSLDIRRDRDNDGELHATTRRPSDEEKLPTFHAEGVFGCVHYQRSCKLQCHECQGWYTCRFCHDEDMMTKEPASQHHLERNKTQRIMCMRCNHCQKPQKDCENCREELAVYFCDKCKLFDSDETKDIYHCDKCGICRLGLGLGIDFFHCDGCQACLSIELQGSHNCIERATMASCPICGDYMFTSVKPVVYMSPCGHAIHQHCFDEYAKHSYKCPSCQVSVLNMEAQFRVLDKEIEEQPLPLPYCDWLCYVSCNDCKAKSSCRYHILGLRCNNCFSYNTLQLKLVKPEEEQSLSTTESSSGTDVGNDARTLASLNSMRQELLRGHFQREEVSPIINVNESGMLSNIETYMNEYFQDDPYSAIQSSEMDRLQYGSQNLVSTAGLFKKDEMGTPQLGSASMNRMSSFTDRLKQFLGEAPPQLSLSSAFQKFLQGSHQGLSSGDEDDFSGSEDTSQEQEPNPQGPA